MEIALIVGAAVLLFGADKLPKLARSAGQAKKEFVVGQAEADAEADRIRAEARAKAEADVAAAKASAESTGIPTPNPVTSNPPPAAH
ncbi:MAG TPA: twin-arginine translocase TatA/TatE family subunit [Candidatus Cybelea sp.]